MAETTFSRKLDSAGRIMIPVKIREAMGLITGKEYFFSTLEKDGRKYVVIDCGPCNEFEEAVQLIQSRGYKIVQD